MSKITFRADEDLVERLERFDASKSEVMREALRAYIDDNEPGPGNGTGRGADGDRRGSDEGSTLDSIVAERIDAMLAERLDAAAAGGLADRGGSQDLNLTISLEGATTASGETRRSPRRETGVDEARRSSDDGASDARPDEPTRADQPPGDADRECGQCGEPLGAGHVYCPNCGEKASRRVFCECGDELRSDWAFCPSCGRRTPAANVLD